MTFDAGDVVVVPFPFTDSKATKRRPALVLSNAELFGGSTGHSVLAMITSAKRSTWPLDIEVLDRTAAGLPVPCVVRMKLFTLDNRFIERRAGQLDRHDRARVAESLAKLLTL
ncbi:type II toxin-antitoxin system PemK/MazF family toxin [Sphingomonas sp. PB4P5]|uniref:type II toxin-antitoxin system PemK/MazF family toxin n=1 Tax=Parasphingomonas puruogangriensis TaxID=3096155 RepID=UPI002FC5BA5A